MKDGIGQILGMIVLFLLFIQMVRNKFDFKNYFTDTIMLTGKFFGWIFSGFGSMIFGTRQTDLYGSAKFMSRSERSKLLSPSNDGVVIEGDNKLPLNTSFQHIQLTATTGSGKTTRYLMPNLLQLEKQNNPDKLPSIVLTDPTTEVWASCSGWLQSIGYDVRILDFSNPTRSLSWNPFARISGHSDIEKVSDVLITSAYPESNANTSFWNESAKNVISALIKCLYSPTISSQYLNLHNLRNLLNHFGDGSNLHEFFSKVADPMTFSEIMGILSQDIKTLQGSVATARSALRLLSNPDVAKVTATDTLHFEDLRKKPVALFLFVPEDQMELYRGILSLFYSQLFSFLMEMPEQGKPYKNVFVFLEEFSSLYIPNMPTYVSTLRKRNVSLSVILQSESQVEARYGKQNANTILSNLNTKIYFGGLDIETCKKLEETLGRQTVQYRKEKSGMFSGFNDDVIHEMGKPLMSASEIRMMTKPLLLSGNLPPTILDNMKAHFEIPHLMKRAKLGSANVSFHSDNNPLYFLDLNSFKS